MEPFNFQHILGLIPTVKLATAPKSVYQTVWLELICMIVLNVVLITHAMEVLCNYSNVVTTEYVDAEGFNILARQGPILAFFHCLNRSLCKLF